MLVYLLGSVCAFGQEVQFVPGSTTPRVQLTGEHFQIFSNGIYFADSIPARTLALYGVLGTDLGIPIVYPDKIMFLFGDTVGAYQSGDRYLKPRPGPNGAGDSIGYIPNVDLDRCRYIAEVDQQLARGVARPIVSQEACPAIRFYTNPLRGPNDQVFKPIVISGLLPEEGQGEFRVPAAALNYNDRLYLFYTTRMQDARPVNSFVLQSIVARSDQSPALWGDANPPTFTRLYTVSSHPQVADPANPPPEAGDAGKFMFNPSVVMDFAALAALGLTQGLPPALRTAANVVFVLGSGWRVATSNLYLTAFSLPDIEAGPSRWFYYAGNNQWSNDERQAAPLLPTSDVAHHSVVWNSALRRFILMRTTGGRILAHFSTAPWGPWSTPVTVLSRTDSWTTKLLHRPGLDPIVQSLIPIYNNDGSLVDLPNEDTGVLYSPNLIDKFTQNPDGSVTVFYTVSTWNPYQVFLMSSTFRPGAP